jgi:peptidoglycan/xylan/chitin deacetylase (PgdA/CDA1 family)
VSPFKVALTFDTEHPDRPAADGNPNRLLDELARLDVRASFFVQGRWAEAYPATARRIVAAGHLVGSHSHYHVRMPLLTADGLATDVRDAEEAIREHAGVDPRPWFRCPFGAGADDPVLVGRLAALGYREVGWHVNPEDWNPGHSPDAIIKTVVHGVLEHGEGVIVLHHAWPDQTLVAIPEIVSRLRDAGATFAGLDELADVPGLRLEPQIAGDR